MAGNPPLAMLAILVPVAPAGADDADLATFVSLIQSRVMVPGSQDRQATYGTNVPVVLKCSGPVMQEIG